MRVAKLLEEHYNTPRPAPPGRVDPLEVLVLTILSQNTNDLNRDRAMARLMNRFPTWDDVARSNRRSLEAAIRVGGLARQKSERIKEILRWVKSTFGEYSLAELENMPTDRAHEMLMNLKGVGPKTAAIVLLFAFGRPVFPVDTHIHRVTTRLGLLDKGTSAAAAHEILGNLFPPENFYSIHMNIIGHGREVCHARNPHCGGCFLAEICPWPGKNDGK